MPAIKVTQEVKIVSRIDATGSLAHYGINTNTAQDENVILGVRRW